jgi:hypothetical protein
MPAAGFAPVGGGQMTAAMAGVRRKFAPHQLRHAHAVEMAHEGVPFVVIQRQLGHAHLGITSVYLQGIDNSEIINTVHARRAPMIPASAGLRANRRTWFASEPWDDRHNAQRCLRKSCAGDGRNDASLSANSCRRGPSRSLSKRPLGAPTWRGALWQGCERST